MGHDFTSRYFITSQRNFVPTWQCHLAFRRQRHLITVVKFWIIKLFIYLLFAKNSFGSMFLCNKCNSIYILIAIYSNITYWYFHNNVKHVNNEIQMWLLVYNNNDLSVRFLFNFFAYHLINCFSLTLWRLLHHYNHLYNHLFVDNLYNNLCIDPVTNFCSHKLSWKTTVIIAFNLLMFFLSDVKRYQAICYSLSWHAWRLEWKQAQQNHKSFMSRKHLGRNASKETSSFNFLCIFLTSYVIEKLCNCIIGRSEHHYTG